MLTIAPISRVRPAVTLELWMRLAGNAAEYQVAPLLTKSFLDGQALGAFDDDKLVGIRISTRTSAKELFAHALLVEPEYRRHGIARKLSLAAREESLKRGIRYSRSLIDLRNEALVAFTIQGLGLTAFGVDQRGMSRATWDMEGDRAKAAAAGDLIPIDFQARINNLTAGVSGQDLKTALAPFFNQGLAITGYQPGPEFTFGRPDA